MITPSGRTNASFASWRVVVLVVVQSAASLRAPAMADEVDRWQQLMISAVQAQRAGAAAEAERLANEALAIAEQAGPVDFRLARSQMLLGEIYRWEQKFDLAERSYKNAVASGERVTGPDHPQMVAPLDSLANFYYYHGHQYDRVLPLYERILRIIERDPKLDERDVAQRTRNLANVYRLLGNSGQAEAHYKRAIELVERISPYSPDLPQFLLSLANFYRLQDRCDEAEPLAKRALAICEDGIGSDSLGTAVCLDELAAVFLASHQAKSAESLYARGLAITEHVAGRDHSDLAPRLMGIADAQRAQGKHQQAEANYRRAISVVEDDLGRHAAELIPILKSYAALLQQTHRAQDAAAQMARARSIPSGTASP